MGLLPPCEFPKCRNEARAKKGGYCSAHGWQLRTKGKVTPLRTAPGTHQQWIRDHLDYEGDDCLWWPFYQNEGHYPLIKWGRTMQLSATVMCELRNGVRPSKNHEAAHNCGNGRKGCVNPNHMRWATKAENQADRILHGTDGRGERHPLHKLTNSDVLALRRMGLRGDGAAQRAAAEQFGVSVHAVQDVVLHRSWRHL